MHKDARTVAKQIVAGIAKRGATSTHVYAPTASDQTRLNTGVWIINRLIHDNQFPIAGKHILGCPNQPEQNILRRPVQPFFIGLIDRAADCVKLGGKNRMAAIHFQPQIA
jgi:hypothetical protein